MSTLEDFRKVLQVGESDSVEFLASAANPRFVQSICAMANSGGGVIFIGVADSPDDPSNAPTERKVTGVDPAKVQRVTRSLDKHFDDPLPKVREEQLAHRGPDGPVVAVHVEGHSGEEQIALSDRTIWLREKGQNTSFMARVRQLRPNSQSVEQKLDFEDEASVEVVRGESSSPEPTDENPNGGVSVEGSATVESIARLGSRSVFRRESSGTALDANGYASVVANLLASADNDERMSVAIFGHWGRGKTFLAKRMAEHLDSADEDRPKYSTVLFSAWKYRSTPEVWAYLFERFLQEGKKGNFFLILRASLVRHGPWPLILAMFGLFASLWTLSETTQLLTSAVQLVGLGTIAYVAFLYVRFRSVAVRLKSLYAFAGHADKLGLQAAIGDDLRALLLAWCRNDRKKPFMSRIVPFLWPLFCYVLTASLISWKLWPVKIGAEWTFPLVGEISTGINPYIAFAIYAFWCAAWLGAPIAIYFFPRKPTERVLLIVDDLDRCEPKQMLEIIESTMLILDDNEVHQRLQVCMLIDESAFCHAIIEKYEQLLKDEHLGEDHKYTANRIIRENLEKFFLLHLRLTALSDQEVSDVMEHYVSELCSDDEPESAPRQAENTEVTEAAATVETVPQGEQEGDAASAPPKSDSIIESHEAEAIRESLKQYLSSSDREQIGPRALRCLLFRYQLARDILAALGETHPDPRELAKAIVATYAEQESPNTRPSRIESVVKQVS